MKRVVDLLFVGLLLAGAAARAETEACSVRKGLYNDWVGLSKHGTPARSPRREALVADGASRTGEPAKDAAIVKEYQEFFQRLSNAAEQKNGEAIQSCCSDATADPLASLVCRGVAYVRGERIANKEFLDAFPSGKRGAQVIWDLETVAADQAYKLIDELFVLVLDDREIAVSKYFNLLATASGPGERHMDDQLKILLRESPAVVVKQWAILRRYQPKLKKLISEIAADTPKPGLQKMRQGLVGFCPADNLDCPEILKLFGRPE